MLIHAVAHPGGDDLQPTLIALHGYGAHAQDLLGLQPALAGGRLLMLCPQAPHSIEVGYPGYSWSVAPPGGGGNADGIAAAAEAVLTFIESATRRYPIDPTRIALLGFSQGGMVATRIALQAPERFAGLALLSTRTAERSVGTLTPATGAERLPVLVQHGERDQQIAVEEGRATLDRLRALGLDATYQEYPMGHEVSSRSAADLSTWLALVLRLDA